MNAELSTGACTPFQLHIVTIRFASCAKLMQAGLSSTPASGAVCTIISSWHSRWCHDRVQSQKQLPLACQLKLKRRYPGTRKQFQGLARQRKGSSGDMAAEAPPERGPKKKSKKEVRQLWESNPVLGNPGRQCGFELRMIRRPLTIRTQCPKLPHATTTPNCLICWS